VKANLLSHETGSAEEFPNANARRLLAKSFTATEMEYLTQDSQFQKALAEMNSFDAFERAATLGHLLLIEREQRNTPSNIIRQSFSSHPHL
jgi:hypothetical protein